MRDLLEGHRRFRETTWPGLRSKYERLARRGQSPHTLVVASSDSRVDPQAIFSAEPGELFVIRNVANIVPPYEPDGKYHGTSAALQFGVKVLRIPRIVVLGHARCGGVKALVEGAPRHAQDYVDPWLSIMDPVLSPVGPDYDDNRMEEYFERRVIKASLANLKTFPWIEALVGAGALTLQGFRFDIATSDLDAV